MPLPIGDQEEAAECLSAVKLLSFTAEPPQILGGQVAVLKWAVDASKCPFPNLLGIYLGATKVSESQTFQVRPAKTSSYTLSAHALDQTKTLGTVNIHVDDSACQPLTFPASGITPSITAGIKSSIDAYNADPGTGHKVYIVDNEASIDDSGINIHLKLGIDINDFPDPYVDIEATIAININDDGTTQPYYKSFSVNVNWPWYIKFISPLIVGIVEHFIGVEITGKVEYTILDDLAAKLNAEIAASGSVVTAVDTAANELILTLCPVG